MSTAMPNHRNPEAVTIIGTANTRLKVGLSPTVSANPVYTSTTSYLAVLYAGGST